jgi:hypothetical protein
VHPAPKIIKDGKSSATTPSMVHLVQFAATMGDTPLLTKTSEKVDLNVISHVE